MLQRLSLRLALWMVLVTIVLQIVHAVYRLSTEIPQAKQAGFQEIEKVVGSLRPAITEALYQYNDRDSQKILKTFEAYQAVQAVWLLDEEQSGVIHWARSHSSAKGAWQQYQWPLSYKGQEIGRLQMTLDFNGVINDAKDRVWLQIWFSCLMGIVNLLLLYWVAQYQVTRPIRELAQAVGDVNTADFKPQDLTALNDMKTWAEVETLRLAMHDILSALSHNIADKKKTMELLQQFNESLEERVLERTQELNIAKDRSEVASRSKTDFLNNMTHELRTPLNSIMGFSSILKGQALPEKSQVMVGRIHQSGNQLLTLINDIIDFADLDGNELHSQNFSLYDVIDSIHLTFVAPAQEKGLKLSRQVDDRAIMCGDPRRLGVVLRHLIGNAVKFTEQGEVKVLCEILPNENINISVEDTGVGINLAELTNLNKAFVQADGGLNRSQQGVGLGLAIVERICSKWGGELQFSNVEPHGTKVVLELPNLS